MTKWEFIIRCPKGHMHVVSPVLTNTDGHGVVPLPSSCPSCGPLELPARLTWREKRAFRRLSKGL